MLSDWLNVPLPLSGCNTSAHVLVGKTHSERTFRSDLKIIGNGKEALPTVYLPAACRRENIRSRRYLYRRVILHRNILAHATVDWY
jgi:hypothetical protein